MINETKKRDEKRKKNIRYLWQKIQSGKQGHTSYHPNICGRVWEERETKATKCKKIRKKVREKRSYNQLTNSLTAGTGEQTNRRTTRTDGRTKDE